jgi:drug/metabolite transporter (DMT)-like permease
MAIWLVPTLVALLLYGLGQGLVKKYIAEVAPARFCLYFVAAKLVLQVAYYGLFRERPLLAPGEGPFVALSILAYVVDGAGWLLYFQAIVHGPIAIVGTLSAAYPALSVVFARLFLGEALAPVQYVGVALVIGGCVGLSYAPAPPGTRPPDPRWIPLSFMALLLWGCSSTLLKGAYRLPGADEVNVMIYSLIGALSTLGVYGVARGRPGAADRGGWLRSFVPMGMLAAGDMAVIVATRYGPVSLITPLSGAYPLVTVVFARVILGERFGVLQAVCIAAILSGMALTSAAGG